MRRVIIICIFVFIFSVPTSVGASEVNISTITQQLQAGERFAVDVIVDTKGKAINTIEGSVYFDSEALSIDAIWHGDSIIPLWVEKPTENASGHVQYSGVIPGGYEGASGKVFTIIFTGQEIGETHISFEDMLLLAHKQQPDPIAVAPVELAVTVTKEEGVFSVVTSEDTTPPQPFVPQIAHGPDMFDGAHFVIFNTVDDHSGVAYYEIFESKDRIAINGNHIKEEGVSWRRVESPIVLHDQSLESYVYIKAVDQAGNVRIEEMFPHADRTGGYKESTIFGIIGLVVILATICALWFRRKKRT